MEPSSSNPESTKSTEKNSSTTFSSSNSSSSTSTAKADPVVTTIASVSSATTLSPSVTTIASTGSVGTTTLTTSVVSSTITTSKASTPAAVSSVTTPVSVTISSPSNQSNPASVTSTISGIKNTPTTSTSVSSSVTISLGVSALQHNQSKVSPPAKRNPSPPQTKAPTVTKDEITPGKSGESSELTKTSTQVVSPVVEKLPSEPQTVKSLSPPSSALEISSGMKRPAPTSTNVPVIAGVERVGSSLGDPDSDSNVSNDPKKKKMRKETVKETATTRSESPGVGTITSSTGSGSGRPGRGASGKQSKGGPVSAPKTLEPGKNSSLPFTTSASAPVATTSPAATVTTAAVPSSTGSVGTGTVSIPTVAVDSAPVSSANTNKVQATTSVKQGSHEGENMKDDIKSSKNGTAGTEPSSNGGPKVPPLKIVLQSHSASASGGSSNVSGQGKPIKDKDEENSSSSSQNVFPYIVSSTTSDTGTVSKDSGNGPKLGPHSEDHKEKEVKSTSPGSTSKDGVSGPLSSGSASTGGTQASGSLALSASSEISSSQSTVELTKSKSPPISTNVAVPSAPAVSSSSLTSVGNSGPVSIVATSIVSSSSTSNQSHLTTSSGGDKSSQGTPSNAGTAEPAKAKLDESGSGQKEHTSSIGIGSGGGSKDGGNAVSGRIKDGKSGGVSSSSTSVEDKTDKEKEVRTEKERDINAVLSGLKEKPTRVTRSSHRILASTGASATPNSPSSVSPKTSACPSPSTSQHGDEPKQDEKMDTSEPVDLHPRKRKLKQKEQPSASTSHAASSSTVAVATTEAHAEPAQSSHSTSSNDPPPMMNCFEMYFNIRKQIARRRRNLFPVTPKPPKGFKDYLMNRATYILQGNANSRMAVPLLNPPQGLAQLMKDMFVEQEKERHKLRLQHVVEKEKLVLSVEQEILRVHGRAARALSNQTLPFSVCTILKDEEVYSLLTPEQEEKDINARSRYNGRLFLSWLQDVDDKWDKIKEQMLLRHHNEAESLHAVQKMDWEWKLKEVGLCEPKATPSIEDHQVPMVHVSDDFDLLPA